MSFACLRPGDAKPAYRVFMCPSIPHPNLSMRVNYRLWQGRGGTLVPFLNFHTWLFITLQRVHNNASLSSCNSQPDQSHMQQTFGECVACSYKLEILDRTPLCIYDYVPQRYESGECLFNLHSCVVVFGDATGWHPPTPTPNPPSLPPHLLAYSPANNLLVREGDKEVVVVWRFVLSDTSHIEEKQHNSRGL